jgi:hypothetical protein
MADVRRWRHRVTSLQVLFRKYHWLQNDTRQTEVTYEAAPLAVSCVLNCPRAAGKWVILMERLE